MPAWGRLIGNFNGWRAMGMMLAVAWVVAAAPDARAQSEDLTPILDRLERLERDIRTLNIQLSRGGAPGAAEVSSDAPPPSGQFALPEQQPLGSPPPRRAPALAPGEEVKGPAAARLAVRLTTLEEELRGLIGQIEELGFRFGQLQERVDKLVADVDYRLNALEGRAAGAAITGAARAGPSAGRVETLGGQQGFATAPRDLGKLTQSDLEKFGKPGTAALGERSPGAGTAGAAPVSEQPVEQALAPAVLPPGSSKEQYRFAFGLLRRAEYQRAEAALAEFLRLHPTDPLAANARYWLGETHYVRADFVTAAEVFLDGYQKAPKGPKAADTLLKLGMSLGALDKKEQACATFGKLAKDFPELARSLEQKLTAQKQRLGCP